MPPVVAAAGISAGAGLLGGLIQSGANRGAQRSQERANDQAIALQREQMAEERRRYDQQQASYAQWYRQQMDIRRQIAGRYGITLPGDEAQAQARPGKTSGAPAAGTMPSGLTLGGIMGGGGASQMYDSQGGPAAAPMTPTPTPTQSPTPQPAGQTLGDMMGPNWSDWRNTNYG